MVPEKSAFDFISAVDEQKKDKQEVEVMEDQNPEAEPAKVPLNKRIYHKRSVSSIRSIDSHSRKS